MLQAYNTEAVKVDDDYYYDDELDERSFIGGTWSCTEARSVIRRNMCTKWLLLLLFLLKTPKEG